MIRFLFLKVALIFFVYHVQIWKPARNMKSDKFFIIYFSLSQCKKQKMNLSAFMISIIFQEDFLVKKSTWLNHINNNKLPTPLLEKSFQKRVATKNSLLFHSYCYKNHTIFIQKNIFVKWKNLTIQIEGKHLYY